LDASPAYEADASYLTVPLRGLLSIFIVLCGLASGLYYMQDRKNGLYTPFSCWYHLPAVVMAGASVLLALLLTGYFTNWLWEVFLMGLFILAVAGFCDIIRLVLRKTEYLAAAFPILVLLILVFCPVFFAIKTVPFLPYLLPPFYYLNALYNRVFDFYFGIYIIVLFGMRLLLGWKNRGVR
jgi:ABC-2 type transport system permease protein